jgi:hypothetical protein
VTNQQHSHQRRQIYTPLKSNSVRSFQGKYITTLIKLVHSSCYHKYISTVKHLWDEEMFWDIIPWSPMNIKQCCRSNIYLGTLVNVTNLLSYMQHCLKNFSTTCFGLYGHHQMLNSYSEQTAVLIWSYSLCGPMYVLV